MQGKLFGIDVRVHTGKAGGLKTLLGVRLPEL